MTRLVAASAARFAAFVIVLPSTQAYAGQSSTLYGNWYGKATVKLNGRQYSLPAHVSVLAPIGGETNTCHLALEISRAGKEASSFLISAIKFSGGAMGPFTSGGTVALTYFNVTSGDNWLHAVLRDNHTSEAAAYPCFYAPNVAADPDSIVGRVQGYMGDTTPMYFQRGTTVDMKIQDGKLTLEMKGTGKAMVNLTGSMPDMEYRATATMTHTRPQ